MQISFDGLFDWRFVIMCSIVGKKRHANGDVVNKRAPVHLYSNKEHIPWCRFPGLHAAILNAARQENYRSRKRC